MTKENKIKGRIRKNINSNLDLLRLIYVISYTLGYLRIAEIFPYDISSWSKQDVIVRFTAVVLFLLSVRFYWAVGNLRRYLMQKLNKANGTDKDTLKDDLKGPFRLMMFMHVPALMAHSFIFFVLCRYLVDISKYFEEPTTGEPPFIIFLLLYCGLLVTNALWLKILTINSTAPYLERYWIRNNVISAFVGAVWVGVAWGILGVHYEIMNGELFFFVGLIIFLVNSGADFFNTYEAYTSERPG